MQYQARNLTRVPFLSLLMIMIFCLTSVVQAYEIVELSTTATVDVKTDGEQPARDSTQAVTDMQLKAAEGSLSRLSLKSNLWYLGSDMGNTAGPNQPNPDHLVGNYAQKLKAQASAQYRFDANDAMNLGVGISANHPNQDFNHTDTNNPYLTYSRAMRDGALQMINSPGLTYYTNASYTGVADVAAISHTNNLVYDLGVSRYSLSLDTTASYNFYSRAYIPPKAGKPYSGDYTAAQYTLLYAPGVKYNVTDHLNLVGNVCFGVGNPRAMVDGFALANYTPKATLGLGYNISHDIYINPFIMTYPTIMSADQTSLNVQTIVSLL